MAEKCTECGAYVGHSPLCSKNTPEQIKDHLKAYVQAFTEHWERDKRTRSAAQDLVNKARKEAEFWKGKFMVVKHENNELRKKVNPEKKKLKLSQEEFKKAFGFPEKRIPGTLKKESESDKE